MEIGCWAHSSRHKLVVEQRDSDGAVQKKEKLGKKKSVLCYFHPQTGKQQKNTQELIRHFVSLFFFFFF